MKTALLEQRVLQKITGRDVSLFKNDLDQNKYELNTIISKSRVLVIGAAGSVGSSFVNQIAHFSPKCLHLMDTSENNLVEVVRDLRCSAVHLPMDFQALPIALGSTEAQRYLKDNTYDYILNFSALKHVRSEKDPYSLMRMYDTNVRNVHQLLSHLENYSKPRKFFSVSSDKAVNPHNIMGATKIFMERIHLLHSDTIPFSTARFANVAFSDGSLLYGFHKRIEKNQPIAAPTDTRRYFISHEEAGQLCLLSCFMGLNRQIYFPKLDPDAHLVPFSEIAVTFLERLGLMPDIYTSEEDAKNASLQRNEHSTSWPCFFFTSTTTGEKPFEEFYTADDPVDLSTYQSVGVISQKTDIEKDSIIKAMNLIEEIKRSEEWRKEDIVNAIQNAVPELHHNEKGRNLDQQM